MSKGLKKIRTRGILGIGASLLVVIVGCIFWYFSARDSSSIPRKYTKGISFALYYPSRLPNGYWVDKTSFQHQDDVIVFSIKSQDGKNVAVAEQATPANAPTHAKSSAPMNLPNETYFDAPVGNAHISLWGDRYVSDIITPEGTWIILNVTGFTTQEAITVSDSFTKIQ